MSNDFFLITLVFFIFLIIAYYLKVFRLSVPLVMIYCFYLFSLLIDNIGIDKNNFDKNYDNNTNLLTNGNDNLLSRSSQKKEKTGQIEPIPIVVENPKPIKIGPKSIINKLIPKIEDEEIETIEENNNIYTEIDESKKLLKLNEIMICRGIYKRNPINPDNKFFNNVDSLFCYTKISNPGIKQQIKHVWYYMGKEITSVNYNIKQSFNYRSWSKKTILPNQIGKWKVEVIDNEGNILGSRDFEINSTSTSF